MSKRKSDKNTENNVENIESNNKEVENIQQEIEEKPIEDSVEQENNSEEFNKVPFVLPQINISIPKRN